MIGHLYQDTPDGLQCRRCWADGDGVLPSGRHVGLVCEAPLKSTVVHFWEILDPHPTFLCGKEPEQGRRNVAPALRVTPDTVSWFARHRRSCQNCLRVARARIKGAA